MPATKSVVVVGPMTLANYLTRVLTELSSVDIEADIRSDPGMYYPEYKALCDELKTKSLSKDAWIDLCRS